VPKVSKATKPTFRHFGHSGAGGISKNKLSRSRHAPETYGIPLVELQELAGDDWPELENDSEQLEAFAHAVQTRKMRESGRQPVHYTQASTCKGCGPVWLWEGAPGHVEGCPWCFNRRAGVIIPKLEEIER